MAGFVHVTLKLATSLDGKIATSTGQSQWITGAEARDAVHALRARYDVILTGIGTVLADDPRLTVRPGGVKAAEQPERAVLDTRLRILPGAKLFEEGPAIIFHGSDDEARAKALSAKGARLVRVETGADGHADLRAALRYLGSAGHSRVLIEAGGKLAASALKAGLVHRLEWFRAPMIIGGDGMDVFAALGLGNLASAPQFRRTSVRVIGRDLHESYEREGN
ncbi:MAG: RibD family protein [Glycocaulis sp.]